MDTEDLRVFACELIQNSGILLKLPQMAMTTAQMLLQRVYHRPDYTFDKYPLDITAMASLFLASKIEENPRKAREVIDVFTRVTSKKIQRKIILNISQHEKIREELITTERRLLKALGFNLLSSYPHKIIVTTYNGIVSVLDPEKNVWKERDNRELLQIAWNYCNDSLRTDVFNKFSQEAVACACIQLACCDTRMLFPKSTDGREWYCLFSKDGSDVESAIEIIKNLYTRKKPNSQDLRPYLYLTTKIDR